MIGIQRLRELAGEKYSHKSDEEFARAYHRKLYPNMNYEEFLRRFQAASADYEKKASKGRKSASGSSGGKQKGFDPMVKLADRSGYGRDKDTGNFYKWMPDGEGGRKLNYDQPMSEDVEVELQAVLNGASKYGNGALRQQAQPQQVLGANQGSQPGGNQQQAQASPAQRQGGVQAAVSTTAPVAAIPANQPAGQPVVPVGPPAPYQPVDIGPDSLGSGTDLMSRVFTGIGNGIAGAFRNRGEAEEIVDYARDLRR